MVATEALTWNHPRHPHTTSPKAIEGLWRYGYICRSSSVSRGGGSQNVIAKNKPLLW